MSLQRTPKHALDDAPGVIGVTPSELPALPDAALTDPGAGRLDPRAWFAHPERPLEIEIGSGKGTFLVEQAPRAPGVNFLGIEYEREFYCYAADRLRRRAVTNVRMLCVNAVEFLKWRVRDGVASVIHLYYSDPWPKAKHHKHRVVQHGFLAEVWRVLQPDGELRVVTDHDELWAWCDTHFAHWCGEAAPGAPAEIPAPGAEFERTRQAAAGDTGANGGTAPFVRAPFVPVEWVGEGGAVGTNYERKKTGEAAGGKQPHACVLRKRSN